MKHTICIYIAHRILEQKQILFMLIFFCFYTINVCENFKYVQHNIYRQLFIPNARKILSTALWSSDIICLFSKCSQFKSIMCVIGLVLVLFYGGLIAVILVDFVGFALWTRSWKIFNFLIIFIWNVLACRTVMEWVQTVNIRKCKCGNCIQTNL